MEDMKDHLGRPVVAVTGIGVVTSLGVGKADNWAALTAGRSGIHPIRRFPIDHLPRTIAGTVDFLPSSDQGLGRAHLRACRDGGARGARRGGFDNGDFAGPLFVASPPVETGLAGPLRDVPFGRRGRRGARLLKVARDLKDQRVFETTQFGTIADRLADSFGTQGLPITLSTACASGATAIQLGVEAIRRGEATGRCRSAPTARRPPRR